MELERLAYDSALRALDKQESLLDEVRSRTGILLAASALAASFLVTALFETRTRFWRPRPSSRSC